jgi:simple sugar transport system ATP-binding protein
MMNMPTPSSDQHLRPPSLELVEVTKRFGSFTAVDKVSMKIPPGTFHALLGENGAGKSTLVKCIMGFHKADEGDIIVNGKSRDIDSPYDAYQLGIGMVYQHFTLVPSMTAAENLVLSRSDTPGIINWKTEFARLDEFMKTAPFKVNMHTPAAQLAAGQKQKVEILKQLYLKSRLLILDEPTSVLTPQEAEEVLGLLKAMVAAGQLSVLHITHKFKEVMAFADEITVLRRGKFAGRGAVKSLTPDDMATMMMGEQRTAKSVERVAHEQNTPVIEIKEVRASRDNGIEAVRGVSLTVHAGEVVGIAGVSGNGQRELVEVLAGQRQATHGKVHLHGEVYYATRQEMFQHRIFSLPEEPLRNACVPHMTVAENLALRTFDRAPLTRFKWVLNRRAMRQAADLSIKQFNIKTRSSETPIRDLSGGNVQRAVLARELSCGTARALIVANPCFGLDFVAVEFIHSQILAARNRGVGVLLICEDLDELLELADRVVVISDGSFVYESPTATADIKTIGHHMAGH